MATEDIDDIEAYLEAQVDGKTKSVVSSDSAKQSSDGERQHDKDHHGSDDKKSSDMDGDIKDRSDRDRHRDRERRRGDSRDRSDRDRHRDRDRDGDRERRRGDSRDRSDRDRHRDRDRDGRYKGRDSRRRSGSRERRPREERSIEDKLLKEANDLTKDQRTLFVGQLTSKTNEDIVKEFFGQLGEVRSVTMVRDKHSGKHKGFAYVEMQDLDTIPNCLLFHNVVPDFQKFPILVKASEAEKNYLAKKDAGSTKNVWTAEEMDARNASNTLQASNGNYAAVVAPAVAAVPSSYGPGGNCDASNNWGLDDNAPAPVAGTLHNMSHISGNSRTMLMARLGGGVMADTVAAYTPVQPPVNTTNPVPAGEPSVSFVINNMFDLAQEIASSAQQQSEWNLDLQEEVIEECNNIYGAGGGNVINHCHVDTKTPGGYVFLKCINEQVAVKIAKSLCGRWFAGRLLTVTYIPMEQYNSMFP